MSFKTKWKETKRIRLTHEVRQDLKKKSKTTSNMMQRNFWQAGGNVEVLCLSYNPALG